MTAPISRYQYTLRLFQRNYIISAENTLLGILAIAIVLRILVAILLGNVVTPLPGLYDQVSYDSLAQRVADGYGFSFAENHWPMTQANEPTAHWSFLYTGYLASLYGLFGHQPLIARLLQALIVGGLQTYLTYLIAQKTFSKCVGLIAAGISAFYAYFVYYSGALMTEPFYITAILYSLFLAVQIAESTDRKRDIKLGLVLGVGLGITILLRQVFLLFIPFLFLWIWLARFKQNRRLPILTTTLALGIVILCIIPFSLYNESRFGRFVLLNTNSGFAFFWGNHPIYGTKFIPILPSETYRTLIPQEFRHLDEAALDQELLRQGIQFIFDDPKRYFLLSLSRIPAYFMFWPSSDSGLVSNISRVLSFGITLPFMIYGLILSIRKNNAEKGNDLLSLIASPIGLMCMFILIYSAIHLLTWALIRYRLPVDAVMIIFSGFALNDLYQRLHKPASAAPPLGG